MKNNKGITLIALVITIVLMLILVGVTVTVINDGNLFKHAENSVTQTEQAQQQEEEMVNEVLGLEHQEPTAIRYGDANLDGTVSISDVSTMNNYLITGNYPNSQARLNCDLNLDGRINQSDIDILNDYLSGRVLELPYFGETTV